jgi:hemerythrin-like domain-containing protein
MHKAIETLMHEHRVIEQVLDVLETRAERVREGGTVERAEIRELVEFLSGFADRCHHGKEEDLLFARMVEHGFPREQGPIGVMLHEHDLGRAHVRVLRAVADGTGPLGAAEREAFVGNALAYVPLLRQHIAKEDEILYPMALQALSSRDLDALIEGFSEFEESVMGAGEHERLHAVADRILASAPAGREPRPVPACHACHGSF